MAWKKKKEKENVGAVLTFQGFADAGPQKLRWSQPQLDWLASLLNAAFQDAVVRAEPVLLLHEGSTL